ncbi:MAG: NAD-dependent succinate-semialdehyde dehydrogenase [Gammaproteobacteria bacterium]|jgi:succinate-semialdehyde dehydrogenase/glutarate-semialdehyde dehydrogenase|nr:NAD-dependent succinate-semialdehyde dehydrogenase [Gammaproteobacteria bacterium]
MADAEIDNHAASALADPSLFRQTAYIGGEWAASRTGNTFDVINPATDEKIGVVPRMSANEAAEAVRQAEDAFAGWRATLAKDRAKLLRRWAELINENKEDLALLVTLEQGKPLAEARGEVGASAASIEWFAEEAKRAYGDVIPHNMSDRRLLVTKEPIGVCAAITPWNFPSAMVARKCAPALAAGCTIVLKPAEQTPFSALALAALAERAGIPKGVFNVITGDAQEIGEALTSSSTVRKLSFTGSTAVGAKLMANCAPTLKKLSLELGGNAPFIVFDDANIDQAVESAMVSKFRNSGQTCVCTNRFLIQDGIYDAFVEKFAAAIRGQLKIGNGLEESISQGPLIDRRAVAKVEGLIDDAVSLGARLKLGGKRHGDVGCYFEPTLLTDVTPKMRLAKEEIFGPLAPVFRFKDEEEAIGLANDTEYGLAAYVHTRDVSRTWRIGEALECGMVGFNVGAFSTEEAPFGGVKHSGFGREGSKYGLDEYLDVKYWCVGGI